MARHGQPVRVSGADAVAQICASEYADKLDWSQDHAGSFTPGQDVEVWPTDSGFQNKDIGRLVRLEADEITWASRTQAGNVVRVHAPRHGFRVQAAGSRSRL
jgi:hypothetical protein